MILELFDTLIFIGLPAIFALAASRIVRQQTSKARLFFISSTIALYVLYGAVFYLAAPTVVSMDLIISPGKSTSSDGHFRTGGESLLPLVTAYLRPIALFSAAALPMLWFSVRYIRKASTKI